MNMMVKIMQAREGPLLIKFLM